MTLDFLCFPVWINSENAANPHRKRLQRYIIWLDALQVIVKKQIGFEKIRSLIRKFAVQ